MPISMIKALLGEEEVLNIYRYGSKVYGTNQPSSDDDYIVVIKGNEGVKRDVRSELADLTVYDEGAFEEQIQAHEISVLECIFLPEGEKVLEKKLFPFTLNKEKLRNAISKKASNSWVKAKKKLIIEKDFDPIIAKKSLFHSLRILQFGIQIATDGKITNYKETNAHYLQIMNTPSTEWALYQSIYQPLYNQLKSDFKKVCPN